MAGKNTRQCNWFPFKLTVPPHAPCYPELLCTTVYTCTKPGRSSFPHTVPLLLLCPSSPPPFLFHRDNGVNQKTISACAHQAIYLPTYVYVRAGSLPSWSCGRVRLCRLAVLLTCLRTWSCNASLSRFPPRCPPVCRIIAITIKQPRVSF